MRAKKNGWRIGSLIDQEKSALASVLFKIMYGHGQINSSPFPVNCNSSAQIFSPTMMIFMVVWSRDLDSNNQDQPKIKP